MLQYGAQTAVQPIPPGVAAHYDTTACWLSGLATGGVTVTNALLHAHLLGRRIWTDRLQRTGGGLLAKVGEVGRDNSWLFNNQYLIPLPATTTLQNGDVLALTCVYNSTGVASVTTGGYSTFNEMCIRRASASTTAELSHRDPRSL